jgi:hypothetical protein
MDIYFFLLLLLFTNTPLFPIHNNVCIQFSMVRTKRKFSEFTPIEKNPETKRARQNRANLLAGKKRKRQHNEDDDSKRKNKMTHIACHLIYLIRTYIVNKGWCHLALNILNI